MDQDMRTYDEEAAENNDPMPVKTLLVMEQLALHEKGMGITDISREVGLGKSTVHRIVNALVQYNYVLKDERTKQYRLGLKVLQLAGASIESLALRDIARPELISLAAECRETVHLVLLEGIEGVYVDKIDTIESIGLLSRIGKRLALYSTAAGKAMLAFSDSQFVEEYLDKVTFVPMTEATIVDRQEFLHHLQNVRADGYAMDCEENRAGVVCIAAPILQGKKPVAAISISGPSFRFTVEMAKQLAPRILDACSAISPRMG